MDIPFPDKLNSIRLSEVVEKYWKSSNESQSVTFDLSDTEWISNAEMVFFIGWINRLINKNISVGIQLPKNNGKGDLKRKKTFQKKLLLDWKLKQYFNNEIKIYDGGLKTDETFYPSLNEIISIPIIEYHVDSFDKSFEKLYKEYGLEKFSNYTREQTSLNHLESELLNYAITKELFSNTVIHSGLENNSDCHYSFSVNKKISDRKANKYNLEQREKELSKLERNFFIERGEYRNIDFIEINFQDFGDGIVNTLKDKYKTDSNLLDKYFEDEITLHKSTNEDSQILHYALLLFTSKYEIDKRFEIHDFIPRGLYILQELVAKYQGYLEIFSGKGAIGISYFKGIKQIRFANKNNNRTIFPGTRIRIVFPSKDSIVNLKLSESTQVTEVINTEISVINLIEILSQVKFDFQPNGLIKDIEKKITLLSIFFESVSKILLSSRKNSIIILDFAGLNRRTEDTLLKLLLFITHSPINTNYRLIIVNILSKQLNSVINQSKKVRKSKGLFIYPIPVIYPDLEIDWIGIDDQLFKKELNHIWKQGIGFNKYLILKNINKHASNIIILETYKKGFKVALSLPAFQEIVTELKNSFDKFIQDEILNTLIRYRYLEDGKHNYNKILREKEGYVYLTSHGILQNEYLNFNNKLYRNEYTRLLVTHLIFHNYASDDPKDLSKVTKILSITLSSQFLACEIKNVLKDLYSDNEAELIALSNYYEFYKEKRFSDIKSKDKVLIINDIISTGRLTETIFDSLEKIEANPITCLVLVDSRSEKNKITRFRYPIVSLTNYHLERFEKVPTDKKILWINPILNAPVTLKKDKHEINSLISPEKFLEFVDEEDIIIGNIKNNAYYLTYYLRTDSLIKREIRKANESLFLLLFEILKQKKKYNNLNELALITKGLNIVKSNVDSDSKEKRIQKIVNQLNTISNDELFFEYNVDLICYPFLSNINEIEKNADLFYSSGISTNTPKIFPIPRVLTEKGWRFTFPPKFLNILTERQNPSILIIDDGSSTGNTIMQMIDSIAFLNAKSIDVLSIFSRLEDFQKELFSRLKSIRAKNNVIPLNIFFGVHMNLPVLSESENPFISESKEIYNLLQKLEPNIDDNFKDYLISRYKHLLVYTNPKDETNLLPIWDKVSKKTMLIYRHKIGKFDSYRMYSEDLLDEGTFEFWSDEDDSILSLLSVLNIEPNLYKVIKRLIPPKSVQKLVSYCFRFFSNNKLDEVKLEFLVKALFYLDTKSFILPDNLLKLVKIFKGNNANVNIYHYFNLQLLLVAFEIRNVENVIVRKGALSQLFEFINKVRASEKDIFNTQFRHLNNHLTKLNESKIGKKDAPINIYWKIQNYFAYALSYEKRHPEKKLEWQLKNFELAVTNLSHSILSESCEQELIEYNKEKEVFKNLYFYTQEEYKYIKSIISKLDDYKPKNLSFNPSKLNETINSFESLLTDENNVTIEKLNKLREKIRFYRSSILFSDSPFNKFIRLSKTNIGKVWHDCETSYKSKSTYKPINIKSDLNIDVTVNSYVMFLAFDNLIQNKIQYADESHWELETLEMDDNRIALRFTQFSKFRTGGTGNGQSEIRGFLLQNGVFYKRESIKPNYVIRIEIPKI